MSSDEDAQGLQPKEKGTLMEKSPRSKRAAYTDKPDAALLSDDDGSLCDGAEDLVLGYSDSYNPSGQLLESCDFENGDAVLASDDEVTGFTADVQRYHDNNSDEHLADRETSLVEMPDEVDRAPIATDLEISKIATALKDTVHVDRPMPGRPVRVTGKRKGKRKDRAEPLIQLGDNRRHPSDSELDHTESRGESRLSDHDDLEWDDQFTLGKRGRGNKGKRRNSDSYIDADVAPVDDHGEAADDDGDVVPGGGLDIDELYAPPVGGKPLIQLDYDTDCEFSGKTPQPLADIVKPRHKVYVDDPDMHQVIMELASVLHRYAEDIRNGVQHYPRSKGKTRHGHPEVHMMQSLPDVNVHGRNNGTVQAGDIRNAVSLNHMGPYSGPYNGHGRPGRNIVSRIMQESESESTGDDDDEDNYTNRAVKRAGGQRQRLGPDLYQRCPDCGERHPPDDAEYTGEDIEVCPDCGVPHNPYQHPPSPTAKDQDENRPDTSPSVQGPHRREELIVGALYKMKYFGSSQVITHHPVTKETRMQQAQEAYSRIKVPDGEQQPLTNVDVVISTERIKVINADDKQRDVMMDHALRTVCFICDMGNILVLMARRLTSDQAADINLERNFSASLSSIVAEKDTKTSKSMCHVFECEQAQMVAKAIGQAFNIAYDDFLHTNGIRHETVEEAEYCHVLESQKIIGKDLPLLADTGNAKDVVVQKKRGEALGIMLIESGWGSMLPTVFVAHLANYAPAARLAGQLAVGDHILACNGASLVGLPLTECNQILKNTRSSTRVILNVVSCPPVVEVLIVRPDTKYQLGFSVKNGTICSLLRGGIAERGGVRVGHRIIEVNGESVVAKTHQHIVDILANTTGEIQMKTMPVAMYRLMVGLDLPQHV